MDIETIKRTYGNPKKEYYVNCCDCPVRDIGGCPTNCDGYFSAWDAIQKYLGIYPDISLKPTPNTEAVNHPAHYNRGKIEVADFIYDQQLNFNRGNAVKYICRAGYKADEVEDLEKAIWYLNHELKMLKECDN